MARSLKVRSNCIKKVKLAVGLSGFPSQRALAEDVGLALSTVSNFLTGRSVDYLNFLEICRELGLDWKAIIEPPIPETAPDFYVERPPIESVCYQEILQPGALIRIKAPIKMGKTSLLDRIIGHADRQGCRAVRLNLLQVETAKFGDLDSFLRWFCTDVSDKLQSSDQLNEHWNQDRGSMTSCTRYFEMLLGQADSPLVLGLDGVDRVFQYPEISQDFFYLLRSWHKEANNLEIWKQLRLVIVHCTEDYGRLDLDRSPFNVGLPMELEEFTQQQVQDLARRHQLDWQDTQVQQLCAMVGGQPYLVQLALAYLAAHPHVVLEQLLQDALTNTGIYGRHLRPLLITLREHPQLAAVLKQVVSTPSQ